MNTDIKKRGWSFPDGLLLSLILLAGIWINRELFLDLVSRVSIKGRFGFPYLIIFGALYLGWLRRSRIQYLRYAPSFSGIVIVALGLAAVHWGFSRDVLIVQHIGAFAILIGGAVSMLGVAFVKNFAAPIGVLFLIIPVPGCIQDFITLRLETISTVFMFSIFEIMNTPCQVLGNQFVIDGVSIKAGKEFSGYQLMMSIAVVVYLFICAIPMRNGARILILLFAPCIALACNMLCLVFTSLVIGWISPESGIAVYHVLAWCMIPVSAILLSISVRLMFWLDIPVTTWRLVGA